MGPYVTIPKHLNMNTNTINLVVNPQKNISIKALSLGGLYMYVLYTCMSKTIVHEPCVCTHCHKWELPGNTSFFTKYGNLPLHLDNCS